MEESLVGPEVVALVARAVPDRWEAARLVRRCLAERGAEPWGAMEIEIWPGASGTLILARPMPAERVLLDARALALLLERHLGNGLGY